MTIRVLQGELLFTLQVEWFGVLQEHILHVNQMGHSLDNSIVYTHNVG